jgi:GTP diphosphokinase / guanosine-3',5'-bis(diphosphate) 3'-diphosphatase
LGLYSIKSELEDLAMKYTESASYKEVENKLKSTKDARNRFIRKFVQPIKDALIKEHYDFKIMVRTKSISSIWRKMMSKGIPFEEVYDVFAIRIILDTPQELEKAECWKVYSIVTDFYQPSPERLRDWISTPRANGYESLHTTVMSPVGKWVEVQIRTKRMDEVAEKGLAAHYKYKESKTQESKFDRWIAEIRDLLENPDMNALDFVNEFKLNLFTDEIYIFTPKGDLRVLPTGSTILDFAYDIHTDIGDKCIGAKVNNRLVPLSYQLESGDQVEIITSTKQKPNEEWLRFVVSARAKQKIKSSLNEERKRIAQDGREILERKFKQHNIRFNSENLSVLEKFYLVPGATELYFRIAKGKIDLSRLREIENQHGELSLQKPEVKKKKRKEADVYSSIDKKSDEIIIGEDFKNIQYKMAGCCNPIPGDDVFGFITINEGIKVHRYNCPNAEHLMSKMAYRCIKARWKNSALKENLAAITVHGIDRLGIVNKLTEIISHQHNVNMKSISFETEDGIFEGNLMVMVYDTEHLEQLMRKFEQVEGVQRVFRRSVKDDN